MRVLIIAAAVAAAAASFAPPADAQRMRAGGATVTHMPGRTPGMTMPRPNPGMHMPRPTPGMHTPGRPGGSWSHTSPRPPMMQHRSRWGGHVNGRWYGGVYAPGGWNAYRRPARGWVLPSYWFAPTFYVNDYASYGLGAPPSGYTWTRYYDDAVLVDGRGRVYDNVSGIDWDRYDDAVEADDYYAEDGYAAGDAGASYGYRERRDNGVGGAIIGGVAGGIAGNAIAGRGDKLAGTLIGAGAGAIVGTAIDKAEDRGRYDRRRIPVAPDRAPPPPYGYDDYPAGGYAPPPASYAPPAEVVQEYHVERGGLPYVGQGYVSEGYAHQGYVADAYRNGTRTWVSPPNSRTVVTVSPAVTTTTVTEYVYEEEVATRATHAWRKPVKKWRPKAKPRQCSCVCKTVCR